MINIDITGTTTAFNASHNGIATLLEATKINIPTSPLGCCICSCRCEYSEKVFSESGSVVNLAHNDKTSMLFTKLIAADSIDIYLCYGDTRVLITDNTYGLFYPYGFFFNKPLYVGFMADWNKIYNSLGAGSYWFETEKTILGVSETIYSICYDLKLYNCETANRTTRIESYNTGVILDSLFDYHAMAPELPGGWYQSFRIAGKLLAKQPKLTVDNYYDQNYKLLQIQDKVSNIYEWETHLLPATVSNQLIYDVLLSNTILLSDFNIFNEEIIRQISLYPSEIAKKSYAYNNNSQFTIKFVTKFDNTIKNNF